MLSRRSFLTTLGGTCAAPLAGAAARRPNILLIVADDLGYSDAGCFGGEIATPNLDRLARGGVRFTQFYNSARCCPSRASLLTGLYPHQAGVGHMLRKEGDLAGYQSSLNNRCVTLAEVLGQAGYSTLMSGKWHVGPPGPVGRGFEEYYGLVGGFDTFWDPKPYTRLPAGRKAREYAPGEFYATAAIADHALDLLQGARGADKPFFLYLAFTAPHFPLHAPRELIGKYAPLYEAGWDRLRADRFARMRRMGLLPNARQLTPRSTIPPNHVADPHGWSGKENPAWDAVDGPRRKDLARRMAVYAAMVEIMDRQIGRVTADLEKNGELENTLILFFSDNGACAEWDPWGFDVRSGPDNVLHQGQALAKMGQPGTYHSYGSGWANASNTPWRFYKHYAHEGGISTPFVAHWPAGIRRRGAVEHQPAHLVDVMATCVEASGARYPKEWRGQPVLPMEGAPLAPAFAGRPMPTRTLAWEHEGSRAIRSGNWKLTALGPQGKWELYDIDRDRIEMNDLAEKYPDKVRDMAVQWDAWARRTGALPWPWGPAPGAPAGGGAR